MTSDHWREADRILGDVLDLAEPERRSYIESACAGSPALAAEVESLLAEERRRGPLDALAAAGPDNGDESYEGRRVGPYRLIREIGRGGMGSVWLAERDDEQFRKRVAVKLIAAGLPVSEALRRFGEERQILASLEHAHIARLLDAGRSDEGLQYIVMEYVEGVPITEYCDAGRLDARARAKLLRTISSTVHFAHQRLVVHRDLKPANILVTTQGEPKLLDFGVAKMLTPVGRPPSSTAPLLSAVTPAYASPEQLRGAPATTSSDVYSLGVLCYELLAGSHPHRVTEASAEEVFEAVCESDPGKPSVAAARRPGDRTSARAVASALAGDLDAIVLKAMRKAPHERYSSAEELAEDLDRYLAGLPVRARRGTHAYRARKFAARHRAGVIAGAVAVVVALAGVSAVVWQAGVARRARASAERRFDDVRKLAGAMIFDLDGRIAALPGSTSARRALVTQATEYLDRLAREAADDPVLALELATGYARVGEVQGGPSGSNLGDSAGAVKSYASARQILAAVLAAEPANLEAQRLLARVHLLTGEVSQYLRRFDEARASFDAGLELRQALAATGLEGDRRNLAGAYFRLADVRGDDPEASLGFRRRALDTFESLLSAQPDDPEAQRNVALTYKTMGATLGLLKRYDEEHAAYLKALHLDEKRVAADPNSTVARLDLSFDTSLLATFLINHADPADALPHLRRTIDIRKSLVAADPKDARVRLRLAFAHLMSGRLRLKVKDPGGALEDLSAARALSEALVSANPDDSIAQAYLAEALANTGYAEQAIEAALPRASPERSAHQAKGCDAFARALEAYRRNEARGTSRAPERDDAVKLRQQITTCRQG
jgi:eukaryotic-like serine/threonine-protein kinase